jgi:tRNA G10  N-methylase Trm11
MVRNDRCIFDSIVCDPPYGVRARTQKVGISENKKERYDEKKEIRDQNLS